MSKTKTAAVSLFWPLNVGVHLLGRLAVKNPKVPFTKGLRFRDTAAGKLMVRESTQFAREAFKSGFEGGKVREVSAGVVGAALPATTTTTGMFHELGRLMKGSLGRKGESLEQFASRLGRMSKHTKEKSVSALYGIRRAARTDVPKAALVGAGVGLGVGEFVGDEKTMEDRVRALAIGAGAGAGAGQIIKAVSENVYRKILPKTMERVRGMREAQKGLEWIAEPGKRVVTGGIPGRKKEFPTFMGWFAKQLVTQGKMKGG